MPDNVIKSVKTQGIGFAPILRHYFEQCDVGQIIDQYVPLDPRRKVLTHGQACVAMITAILFQVLQLYRICQFADSDTVLKVILPDIEPKEYFDDRLADTLDAIYDYGIGNLEMLITRSMIAEFKIENRVCHNDTTSVSVYGNCNHRRTDQGINITFGYSKKHRADLKQFIWSLSVSQDSAFPLFQQAYSGNTADVDTYVAQWHNLIDLLWCRDFLYVADSKLITKDNIAHIHDHEGYFIAPAPMYESYKAIFDGALLQHDYETLLPYKQQLNRGFEVPFTIRHEGKEYPLRMILIFDPGLFARKHKTLSERIKKTRVAFSKLKLNAYRLKTEPAIVAACDAILKKYHTSEFFEYQITNHPVITYKNKAKGRPAKDTAAEKQPVDHFSVDLRFNESAVEQELYRCGYYPLITNKSLADLTIEDAMLAHKNQYKVEHTIRRAKSGYTLEPVYLHTPERIEAFLFLFKIALQMVVLIERTARSNITQRDKGLDHFMPNRMDVRNPKAEYLLREFQYIVSGHLRLPDGNNYGFISELTALQKDILAILEVPEECYTYGYLFNSS
jgi:transposase